MTEVRAPSRLLVRFDPGELTFEQVLAALEAAAS